MLCRNLFMTSTPGLGHRDGQRHSELIKVCKCHWDDSSQRSSAKNSGKMTRIHPHHHYHHSHCRRCDVEASGNSIFTNLIANFFKMGQPRPL